MKTYPLNDSQLGMYLEWNADRLSGRYSIPLAFRFPKSIDAHRLEKALLAAINAQPVFKTRFVEVDGEVRQHIDERIVFEPKWLTLSEVEADRLEAEFPRPFDLFGEPFVRLTFVETPVGTRLFLEYSHLITDGTSISLLHETVSRIYNGEEPSVARPAAGTPSFEESILAERASCDSEEYRLAAEAAKVRFAGRTMTSPEATAHAPAVVDGSEYYEASAELSRSKVEAYCHAEGVHPNLFFMGVFARILALYANEKEAVFYTVNHGRRNPDMRSVLGLFVKTVPVLGEMKSEMPVADYFRSFKLHRAGVYPFTHFCRDLGILPGWGFVFQDGTLAINFKLDGEFYPSRMLSPGGAGVHPAMQILGQPDIFRLTMTAIPGRFDEAFLQRFADRCVVFAENVLRASKDARLGEISLLTDDEKVRVMSLSRGEELEYDRTKTFVDLFLAQVVVHPELTAVVDADGSITYGELDARSDALAAKLRTLGVQPGGFVGLMLPRSAAFPIAMIAVQKCGAGYVPMDGEYPADRLAYMLENSEAKVLVTTKALFCGKQLDFKGEVVFFEDEPKDATRLETSTLNLATPNSPAYMIYTSGSTGRPKGVVVSNRALSALIAWFAPHCGLKVGKRNLSITSFSFDASVPDLFPPLATGGELHILSEDLRKDLEGIRAYAVKVGATGLTTSTQLGLALVNTYPELPFEYMMLGGEKMVPFAKTPVRMLNGYGPTEFAVCSSYHEVDQAKNYDIPIGRAVPNTWSFVVDALGQLVPAGMTGELALAGEQLADGYWKLEGKTKSVFVECPFAVVAACSATSRMYRTGDLARYNADGELEFLGRIDFQVKLRGFRIEIGEIEHVASGFPGIGATAAEVREVAGAKHLVLYYGAVGAIDENALRDYLASRLTKYMVPDFFVGMGELPLTPNGKIDRRRLPAPRGSDEPLVEPENELEKNLLACVREVLKTDDFGVTHDFNRLGLTSLGAMSLMAKLKKELKLSVTMKQLVANPTVRQLAAQLASASSSAGDVRQSRGRPRRQYYPMTENQRGIYADWLRNPTATQYNIPAAFKFAKTSPTVLSSAAEKVLNAHPALKTRFVEKSGEIVQERRDAMKLEVAIETLDESPDQAFFTAQVKPFTPDAETLARGTVYACGDDSYLFLDIHHTVFDGFSVGVLLTELMRALKGGEVQTESYTAFDAALDERDYLESEGVDDDDKWFERYIGGIESTSFQTSSGGVEGRSGEAGRVTARVDASVILVRARSIGVTASDWFLTAFTELLHRLGREEKTLINFVTSGRSNPDVQETIGMFVKTLPLRGVESTAAFADAARQMHTTVVELLDRERASYVRLSERLGVKPEILFAFEGGIFDLPEGVEIIEPETGTVKAPLAAVVTPGKDDFELKIEYDRSRYSATDMEALVRMFAELVKRAATMPVETPLKALPLLSDEELVGGIQLAHGEEIEFDQSKTVVNLIHANAIARPFATAVVDADGSITYGELDARSDALAAKLRTLGVQPGGFVGLMLPRRLSFVVSLLAAQKCGAGYVPMDGEYPADRLAYMLENSEAKVLITTKALFSGKQLDFKGEAVFFEDEPKDATRLETAALNLATPDSPAYMIYTSGSTGKPKGVVIPQRALRRFCAWTIPLLGLKPSDRCIEHASFSFDASVMDLISVLVAGGELHIIGEELRKDLAGMREYVVRNGIKGGTMSTQIGMTFLDTYPDMPLEYLCVGGEKIMPIAKTRVKIYNAYGPTEFTVVSSVQLVDQSRDGDIPIGRAVPGSWSFIVDRYGHLLPQGFPGELALAGEQIAEGYWKLEEKTKSVFVECPFAALVKPQAFRLMYRTGDLARYNAEGLLEYMGRLDFQVKLRGFRIEIGEIESRAVVYPGVKSVAAEVREVAGTKHLVLYYSSDGAIDEAALKAHLASTLTEYMVPDYFVGMSELPLTPNGKINRKLLPTPTGDVTSVEAYIEPSGETERTIAAAYAEILHLERFGATTDFFAAGGTSLIGIKAVVALQKSGLDVQYGDLFKYKTPRALAAFLSGTKPADIVGATDGEKTGFDYGDYDYTAIDRLLMSTPTELFDGFRRHSLGDVLLTGATGYLGVHVLKYLLESTDATVYALVRPKRGIGSERRIDSQYVYYFGERVPKRFRERLAFVEGDITDDTLTLPPVNTVINCAALVKHYVADDLMDRINVEGVRNLIQWCSANGARLVHASTYSVGGLIRNDSAATLDERHLYIGQSSDNDYVRTKFLAERFILEAVAAGRLRGKIMRLGNLMGREADGEFQMNFGANAFVNSLKSYRALGAYPLENLVGKIEMSPIDRVAEAVCLLATTPDGMCVFHPYNAYSLDMGAVIGAMNRRGFAVDWVSRTDFAATVDAIRNDPRRAGELQGILHYTGHLLKDMRLTPAPNDWTTCVLYRLGFRWRPADDAYLARFFEMLDGLAVFD